MRNQETGLGYAKFDHSDTRIRQAQHVHVTDWRGVYNHLLQVRDYDSAEFVKMRNMISDECANGGHEDCNFSWCTCPHHSAVQFRAEHHALLSLVEIQSERDETEAA